MPPDAGGGGEARGGRGASVHLLEQLRGIGRKCAFYNGFAGVRPQNRCCLDYGLLPDSVRL